MGSCAAPSTKQWHQFTIVRSLQQCRFICVDQPWNLQALGWIEAIIPFTNTQDILEELDLDR